jgi:hypothetical protein
LHSDENLLEKKLWFPCEVANNMEGCKLFNVLIFHFDQNLTKLYYAWWQLKLSSCKTGQKNPSAQGWNNTRGHTIVRMGHRNRNSWPAILD